MRPPSLQTHNPRRHDRRFTPGDSTVDPVRITVGLHHSLGLLALTTEDEPDIEHDLLTHAGFATKPGDVVYTLPVTPHDPAAIRKAVTTLRTAARALGIRIGIDPGLATTLEKAPAPPSDGSANHGRDAPAGPALTTTGPTQPAPAVAPHPIR